MMENYIKQHEMLMNEWIQKSSAADGRVSFAKDGIVNPEKWFSLPEKSERILFLLKEAYDKKPRIWDETKWISHDKCTEDCDFDFKCQSCCATGMTFNPIAEWIYGIDGIACGKEKSYDSIQWHTKESYYAKRDVLLSETAIVNIKKSNGVNGSSNDDLYYYTARDRDLLIKQINLIQPTVIICCGTYGMFRCLFPDLPEMKNLSYGACLFGNWKVIATCHPNKRSCSNEEKYSDVMKLYKSFFK